jgi:hypothetical protein
MTDPRHNLAALVDTGRTWVEIGTVDSVEEHGAWSYLLNVTLQPGGQPVQARPVYAGTGAARGDLWPVEDGDEVLVLCPGGNLNAAVALVGLTSSAAAVPSDWDNAQPQLCHPKGKHFRTAEGAPTEPVLLAKTFQNDAATWEAALYTFMSAVSSATSVGDLVAAALTWGLTCGSYKDSLASGDYSAAAIESE